MWKLYKQQGASSTSAGELDLIMESDSLNDLKSEARRLAMLDGCLPSDQFWMCSEGPRYHELTVDDRYKFIIREW